MNLTRLGAALLTAAALHAAPSQAAERLRVSMNLAPMTAQIQVAQRQGIFARHGLEVEVLPFTSSLQPMEALVTGQSDIATSAESPITGMLFKGHKLALLASLEYSLLKTLAVGADIRVPADLKGRRLGYVAGTGSELCAAQLLERGKLSKGDVTLAPMLAQELPVAAAAGRIDAYCVWEPHVTKGRDALGDKARLMTLEKPYTPTFYIVAGEDFARRNAPAVDAFLRSMLEAERWIENHREEAISLVAAEVKMNRAELAGFWSDYVFEVEIERAMLLPLQRSAQWRIDSGTGNAGSRTMPAFEQMIDAAPLKRVAPERVRM